MTDKKHFKGSYQTVKDSMGGILFLLLVYFVSSKIADWFIQAKIDGIEILEGFIVYDTTFMIIVLFSFAGVWMLYQMSVLFISLMYKYFADFCCHADWYPYLKEFSISVPVTKRDYKEIIKDNPRFCVKYGEKDKPGYAPAKLHDWATKLIEKELNKLRKEAK